MRSLIFFSALLLPVFAEAAGAPRSLADLSSQIVTLLGAATITLAIVAFVVYLWGMASNFFKLNQGESEDMKQFYFWGIAILFVMASVWGILRLMQATVFNGETPGSGGGSSRGCTDFANCPPASIST